MILIKRNNIYIKVKKKYLLIIFTYFIFKKKIIKTNFLFIS